MINSIVLGDTYPVQAEEGAVADRRYPVPTYRQRLTFCKHLRLHHDKASILPQSASAGQYLRRTRTCLNRCRRYAIITHMD